MLRRLSDSEDFGCAVGLNKPGVEGDALAFDLGGEVAKSEVSHGTQAARKDVAKVASDEFTSF